MNSTLDPETVKAVGLVSTRSGWRRAARRGPVPARLSAGLGRDKANWRVNLLGGAEALACNGTAWVVAGRPPRACRRLSAVLCMHSQALPTAIFVVEARTG